MISNALKKAVNGRKGNFAIYLDNADGNIWETGTSLMQSLPEEQK